MRNSGTRFVWLVVLAFRVLICYGARAENGQAVCALLANWRDGWTTLPCLWINMRYPTRREGCFDMAHGYLRRSSNLREGPDSIKELSDYLPRFPSRYCLQQRFVYLRAAFVAIPGRTERLIIA